MSATSKRTTVKEPKWGYYPTLEGRTVEVERLPDEVRGYSTGKVYAVLLDGERIGTVYATTETWERRSKGARYVNSRGETPAWGYQPEGWGQTIRAYHFKKKTRAAAAYELAEEYVKEKESQS